MTKCRKTRAIWHPQSKGGTPGTVRPSWRLGFIGKAIGKPGAHGKTPASIADGKETSAKAGG